MHVCYMNTVYRISYIVIKHVKLNIRTCIVFYTVDIYFH